MELMQWTTLPIATVFDPLCAWLVVGITIPVSVRLVLCYEVATASAVDLQVDGDWHYDTRKSIMLWSIDIIDSSNRTGSLEFVVPGTRPESFFPVTVNFTASRTLCQVRVQQLRCLCQLACFCLPACPLACLHGCKLSAGMQISL